MAKTLMVSNQVYAELKSIKREQSFTQLIEALLEKAHERNSGTELFRFFGALRGETEYARIGKELRQRWKSWSRRYA